MIHLLISNQYESEKKIWEEIMKLYDVISSLEHDSSTMNVCTHNLTNKNN